VCAPVRPCVWLCAAGIFDYITHTHAYLHTCTRLCLQSEHDVPPAQRRGCRYAGLPLQACMCVRGGPQEGWCEEWVALIASHLLYLSFGCLLIFMLNSLR
jgi:hypothetical protein